MLTTLLGLHLYNNFKKVTIMSIEEQYRKPNLASEPLFYFNSDKLSENIAFVKENNIERLMLIPNPNGYNLKNLDFLEEIPNIKELHMGACNQIKNYDGLKFLRNLNVLIIGENKKDKIDFSALENLETLGFWFSKNIIGFDKLLKIKKLGVNSANKDFLNRSTFSKFTELTELGIAMSILDGDLKFLSDNKKVESLTFSHMRRSFDLEGIQNLKNSLKKLKFSSSKKITNVELISKLVNLEWLIFSDSIVLENTDFIKNLRNLEALSVGGSSYFIDGDLRSIKHLKDTIKYFTVREKKHYFYE